MGHFEVHTHEGSVLHLCTKFEADRSIYSKVMGSQILEIGPRDPGHAQLGSFYGPCAGGVVVRPLCLHQILSGYRYSFNSYKGVPKLRNWVT